MKKIIITMTALALSAQLGLAANVSVDGYEFRGAKLVNSVTYVPLRAFTEEFTESEVAWNNATRTATVTGDEVKITIPINGAYIECNDRFVYSGNNNLIIDGSTYVPIRSIAKVLSADVNWNSKTRTAEVTSNGEKFKSANEVYDMDDLYWLSKIINAESEGEPLMGKIAVGNVVLNRVASNHFPNNIYDVIFDKAGGIQFTPTANGSINREPTEASIMAAKICLEDYKISDKNILFFLNPSISTSTWVPNNRDYVISIGRHDFYA